MYPPRIIIGRVSKAMVSHINSEERQKEIAAFERDLERIKDGRGMLMLALHLAQNRFGYVPSDVQRIIADTLKVPLSTVYGVVTFYSRFTLIPRGRCDLSICTGTTCYIQGAEELLKEAEETLGIKDGETSPDGNFSLSTTRCVGACSLAPVVTVNGEVHGRMTVQEMKKLLADLKKQYLSQPESNEDK